MSSPISFGPRTMVIINYPHPNDVLFGRGGICNNHPGNKKYHRWIREYGGVYYQTVNSSMKKREICQHVVNLVRQQDPPGRFLLWNNECNRGFFADEEMILAKVCQAFRDANKLMNTNVNRGGEEDNTQAPYYYPNAAQQVAPATNVVMRNQINNIPPFFEKGCDIDNIPTTTQCDDDDDLGRAISRLYPNSSTAVTTNSGRQAQQTSSTEKMMDPSSASSSKSKFALETTFWKEFPDYGWFQGTIIHHSQITGLYLVSYTDGDSEELDENQIQELLRNNPDPPDDPNINKCSTTTGASLQEGDIITEEVIGRKEEDVVVVPEPPPPPDTFDKINGSGRSIDEPVLLLSDNEDDEEESDYKDTHTPAAETTATNNQEGGIIISSAGATTTTRSSDETQQTPAQTTTCTSTNSDQQQGGDRLSDEPQPEQTESNNNSNQQFNGGAISSDATSESQQQQQQQQQQVQASSDNNNNNNNNNEEEEEEEEGSGGAVGSVATSRASDEPPQQKRQRLDHHGNHARLMAKADMTRQHIKIKSQQQQEQQQQSKYAHLLFSHEKSDVTITCQDDQSSTPTSPTTRPCCGISIQIPAHKKVLAESSSVLKALWLADPTSNTLSFPSCPAPVVKQVLIHIYTNQTIDPTILRSYLPQFLEFTKLFGFEDLHLYAGKQAYNLLNLNNLEKILKASLSVSGGASSMMKDVCFTFIQNHAVEVLTSPGITRLTTEDPGLWREIVQAVAAPKRELFALSCVKKENNEVA